MIDFELTVAGQRITGNTSFTRAGGKTVDVHVACTDHLTYRHPLCGGVHAKRLAELPGTRRRRQPNMVG
jgi:hypothetical protein